MTDGKKEAALLARGGVHAHPLVAKTAIEMARVQFDEYMKDNGVLARLRAANPGKSMKYLETKFLRLHAPRCLNAARHTLAEMLRSPTHKHLHDSIYDALIADNTLRAGRRRT